MARVLVTNGGPHPPEAWAVATAEHILPIDAGVTGERLMAAKKLQLALAEALTPHHAACQAAERQATHSRESGQSAIQDASALAADALRDIVAAAGATPWQTHFTSPAVQAVVGQELATHFATSVDIERQWRRHRGA